MALNLENDSKKLHWPKNRLLMKTSQFYSALAEQFHTLEVIILNKFDGDWTRIVIFSLLVYFCGCVISFESVSRTLDRIFSEPLMHTFSPCDGPVKSIFKSIPSQHIL